MGCTDEGNCCLILPLLSSQIYQAYNNRTDEFTGSLSDVTTPINDCLIRLYQAIKCYEPINCQGLDTTLLVAVNSYLTSSNSPMYQETVQTICASVLSFQPV